jgi:heme A synthase
LVTPASLAILLLLGQAILGGITVLQELPGFIVLAHLALGEALLACMVLVAVVAYRGSLSLNPGGEGVADRFPKLALASAAGVYILLLTGSLVIASGATPACVTWPLCQGEVMPGHPLAAIHMGHRYVAAIIGLFLLYTLHVGIRGRAIDIMVDNKIEALHAGARVRRRRAEVRYLSMLVLALFMAQILVGAFTVWSSFAVELKALHLALATTVWAAMTVLAVASLTRSDYGIAPSKPPGLTGGKELANG